ncbi:MAG: glycosyltransferase family 2 protein [Gammaproteobacteria bacterium]|nr:glycosyltransferase family 2 protein [Gammaproteobacteria bacterium]
MPRLSAVIITRNAARKIEACLEGLAFADEILVYDGGSHDETTGMALRHGARVVTDTDWQDYGIQRRRAQQEARGDWILMVDADERITPELAVEIQAALDADDGGTAYAMARRTWAFGRYLKHGGWWPDYVTRLYQRDHGGYNDALVHERVELKPGTRLAYMRSPLLHHTYSNLHEYLVKSAGYARSWADDNERSGQKASLVSGIVHAAACFLRMYLMRAGFLDGKAGFLLAVLSTHSTFVKYAHPWLRENDPGPPEAW